MKSPNSATDGKPEQKAGTATNGDKPEQDAVTLLKGDHRTVEQLFEKYESSTKNSEKRTLASRICQELIIHTTLEEELFYKACREKNVEHDDLDEAQVEHDTANILIAELLAEKPGDDFFDAKVKVLSEYIKHHVSEEENPSDGIFAKAQEAGVDMAVLGREVQARKSQLLEQAGSRSFGPSNPRSLHVGTTHQSQESMTMPRYSQDHERDDRGRFVSDDDHRGRYSSRYRDDDDHRYGSNGDRHRDENGRFMRDDDDRGRGYGQSRYRDDDYRGGNNRDRDENGRFVTHDERGGMYSSRDRGDDRGYRSRDDEGRFTSNYGGNGDRGRYGRDDDGRNGDGRGRNGDGRGWYGDPRGHAEASHRGWEHRQSGRDSSGRDSSGRYASDDDADRRGYGGHHSQNEDHRGWYGDPEGHAEAARRGWRNR